MANKNLFRVPELEFPVGLQPVIIRFWVDVRDWAKIIVEGPYSQALPWNMNTPFGSMSYATSAEAITQADMWADRTENSQ